MTIDSLIRLLENARAVLPKGGDTEVCFPDLTPVMDVDIDTDEGVIVLEDEVLDLEDEDDPEDMPTQQHTPLAASPPAAPPKSRMSFARLKGESLQAWAERLANVDTSELSQEERLDWTRAASHRLLSSGRNDDGEESTPPPHQYPGEQQGDLTPMATTTAPIDRGRKRED